MPDQFALLDEFTREPRRLFPPGNRWGRAADRTRRCLESGRVLPRPLNAAVAISIEGRPVWVFGWLFVASGSTGSTPVILLDTDLPTNHPDDRAITRHLYGKLEQVVLSRFYEDRPGWLRTMKSVIAKNAVSFNSHRMMRRYVTEAYRR